MRNGLQTKWVGSLVPKQPDIKEVNRLLEDKQPYHLLSKQK